MPSSCNIVFAFFFQTSKFQMQILNLRLKLSYSKGNFPLDFSFYL